MKALGADIVRFFNSVWPEDYYVDESVMSVVDEEILTDEGNRSLPVTEMYDLNDFGYLCGAGDLPLTTFYSRWKKSQSTVMLLVQVPKEKEQEIREMLKTAGAIAK